MKWTTVIAFVASLAAGSFALYVDQHNDEVHATVLVIVVSAGLLGLFEPRHAWLWALAVGSFIPAAGVFGPRLHLSLHYEPQPSPLAYLLPYIPAFVGAYCGAWTRRLAQSVTT
jgi:hypothetical protein